MRCNVQKAAAENKRRSVTTQKQDKSGINIIVLGAMPLEGLSLLRATLGEFESVRLCGSAAPALLPFGSKSCPEPLPV